MAIRCRREDQVRRSRSGRRRQPHTRRRPATAIRWYSSSPARCSPSARRWKRCCCPRPTTWPGYSRGGTPAARPRSRLSPRRSFRWAGVVRNYNTLLGRNGIVGLKTGSTHAAGGCIVIAARHKAGGRKILIVAATFRQPGTTGTILPNALRAGRPPCAGPGSCPRPWRWLREGIAPAPSLTRGSEHERDRWACSRPRFAVTSPRAATNPGLLTGYAVQAFPEQIGMAVMAGVLLEHVVQDPAEREPPRRRARAGTSCARLRPCA